MLLLGLLLAAVTATPVPASPLAQLKTIANVRSTPVCTALREHIGPAIAKALDADDNIAQSPPIFGAMYHDDVVMHSDLSMSFDVLHMENLVTPIAKDISSVKSELKHLPADPDLDSLRKKLEDVIAAQNDALNIINGFVETYQLGEIQDAGPPNVLAATNRENFVAQPLAATSPQGSRTLLEAGLPPAPGIPLPPSLQAENVNLGSSPYHEFALELGGIRIKRDAAELAASLAVIGAVERCTPPASTP